MSMGFEKIFSTIFPWPSSLRFFYLTSVSWKAVLTFQLERLLKEQWLGKSAMAARMKTSRAAVDRLLDASNPSVTLATLGKAARALGRKVKIELVPA